MMNVRALFLPVFAFCALFLPMDQAEAKRKPKPKPEYGGYTAGKTFTFTVTNVVSSGTQGTQIVSPAPIPKGTPKWTVGQKVKFTIGKKGQLVGPGFNIAFQAGSEPANVYVNKPKKGADPNTATVHKNVETGEPIGVSMGFFTFKLVKRVPQVTQVYYTLE